MAASAEEEEILRFKPGCVIETTRLVLRGARESDVDDLHECFQDAIAMRYWNTLPHPDRGTTAKWVEKMIQSPKNGVSDFVMVLKQDYITSSGAVQETNHERDGSDNNNNKRYSTNTARGGDGVCIGHAGIWSDNEIGIIIAREYWRKGLSREAISAILDVVFEIDSNLSAKSKDDEYAGLRDVVADVDPRNEASLAILQRAGFEEYDRKEKTFQIGDEWVDSIYLSLKREVWTQKRTSFAPKVPAVVSTVLIPYQG